MRTGELRHRITLQQLTSTRDAYGGVSEAWADHKSVWASFDALTGKEGYTDPAPVGVGNFRIRIRYIAGVDTLTWRVVRGDEIYNIAAVMPDNRQRSLVLLVRKASYEQ